MITLLLVQDALNIYCISLLLLLLFLFDFVPPVLLLGNFVCITSFAHVLMFFFV